MGFGIFDGIKGLFIKPIEGIKKDGFIGALKGSYKGITGLIIKPITGVLDLTSATAKGIRELATDKSQNIPVKRKRPPRLFYSDDRYYKVYDIKEARINRKIK